LCVKEFADDEPYKFNLKSSLGYTYENGTNRVNRITAKTELGENVLDVGYKNPKDGHMPDAIYSEWWNGSWTRSYNYDDLGRLYTADTRTTELTWLKSEYTYRTISGNRTTSQVSSLETEAGTYSYTYDSRGNISSVSDGTYTTTYTYDNLNQLTRENNQKLGKTYVYTYSNGNITSRKEYAYTTGTLGTAAKTDTFTYTAYSWGDILVAYNGEYFGYTDAKMNSFQGKALTWHYLGLLGSAGSTSFTYDTSGRRLSKTTGGTTTNYYYAGDMLVGQKTGNNELEFMFDSSGDYFGFTYNGTAYYYIKNLQGDVISIFNANGNEVATYTYDAWGRTLATTDTSGVNISAINPIRYRGYYYDTETGFYFLQTRYYVPEICRFLSPDTYVSTGQGILGYNMFAYCLNNPVNYIDPTGASIEEIFAAFDYFCGFLFIVFCQLNGVEYTLSSNHEEVIYTTPNYFPIIASMSETISTATQIVVPKNDTIIPYVNVDIYNILFSTVGLKLNFGYFVIDFCFGLENMGASINLKANENTHYSLGARMNLAQMKAGVELSAIVETDNMSVASTVNCSYSFWYIATIFSMYFSGQPAPVPAPTPAY